MDKWMDGWSRDGLEVDGATDGGPVLPLIVHPEFTLVGVL